MAASDDGSGKARRIDQAPLAGIIGQRLRRAQLAVFQDFIDTFEAMGIRPVDYSIIRLIEANPGARQGRLGQALGIKRANMVKLVQDLEARGLVERRTVAGDRRALALHLTADGARFAVTMQERWETHEQRFIDRLGGEGERDALIALLGRIAKLP